MFCATLIVKNYFEKRTFEWVYLLFVTKNIFKAYFPHFVRRGTSNNLQMLNTQNLPTLLYNVHKISVKYTLTQYNISQYCRQELCCRFPYSFWLSEEKDRFIKYEEAAVPSV